MKKTFFNLNEKGFSLIELIIVIGILTIIGVVGFPSFRNLINNALLQVTKTSIVDCYKNCLNNPHETLRLANIPKVSYSSSNCSGEVNANINGECEISMNMNNGLKIKWPETYQNCIDFKNDNNPGAPPEPLMPLCAAIIPGECGLPPCGDPYWDCNRQCPEQWFKCLSESGG